MFNRKTAQRPIERKRYFVFVEAPLPKVEGLALDWARAPWWPQDSSLVVERADNGSPEAGAKYVLRDTKKKTFRLELEVMRYVSNKVIEYAIVGGAVAGGLKVTVEERSNGTRIDVELAYRPQGMVKSVLWKHVYLRQIERNMKTILTACKAHIEKLHQDPADTDTNGS